ncbi:MAG: hypothetical protein WBE47_02170 [Candidatus Acidiferrales bacterium]
MPSSKYRFSEQNACDHKIVHATDSHAIGELRVKPSSLLWKPKGQHQYYSATLDEFTDWIMENGKLVDK